VGGIGVSGRGKANTPSHGSGSVKGGDADVGVGMVGGKAVGGVAGADRGERSNSLSSLRS
jgi:hypothetical protein